jgi:serine/threonine-protein kinase HipA
LTDSDVAELLSAVREEYRDGRSPVEAAGRFSLAGAQPKIALLRTEQEQWATPHGSTPTTHILKPVSGDFKRIDVVEHMTMRAATLMGLKLAATRLQAFGAERAFITTRYDRISKRGVWQRLHQEDLGQALSVPPSKKYQRQDGGPGVGAVAQLFRGLPRLADRSAAAGAFYQALMFNVTLECTDAHIKNYSVLLEGRAVKFAPLYDLATYAPYKRPGLTTYAAMKIGQEYQFDKIGITQCLDAAKALGVDPEWARDTVLRLRRDAVGAFETARDELIGTDSDTAAFATGVLESVARLPGLRGDI